MTLEFFRNSILQEFRYEKQLSMPKYCDFDDQLKKAKLATFPTRIPSKQLDTVRYQYSFKGSNCSQKTSRIRIK